MEHLSLEIFDLATKDNPRPTGSKYAFLGEDASITITDTSEIFASGDVWSHSFTLNVHTNSHIFGTSGDLHGSRLHEQINKRRARLWVEGLPLYLGYLKLDDEVDVDGEGNVDVGFESGQKTFDDLIEGAKANQVPLMGDVLIGAALWRKRYATVGLEMQLSAVAKDGTVSGGGIHHSAAPVTHVVHSVIVGDDDEYVIPFFGDGEDENHPVQEYPQMVFPEGEFDSYTIDHDGNFSCLNTDFPYTEDENGTPTYPYCNVALCYQKQGYDKQYENGDIKPDYTSEPEAQRGYEYMPANRVNSAPNFYVIYWLRCLMKHLGIYIEENQMMDVEDLRRLFFVNTKCAYRVPKHIRNLPHDSGYGRYKFKTDCRLVPEMFLPYGKYYRYGTDYKHGMPLDRWLALENIIKPQECKLEVTEYTLGQPDADGYTFPEIERFNVTVSGVAGMNDAARQEYENRNSWLHDAFATSECFPDADISEVVSAIEHGFGIRFLFGENYQRVRIVLLRNIFRSEDMQDICCEITDDDVKVENNIRGFRLTYGNSEDTHFYYKGFADKLPHKKVLWPDDSDKHDYSKWSLDAQYSDVINKASAFNKTCYVTPNNGNAYIVKVDKDAKRYKDLHPSIFEGAGFMDAEDGDCTGEDDTIEEINMGFTPAIMNDLNMEMERQAKTPDERRQKFALFVDEKMRPRRPDLEDLVAPKTYNDSDAFYDVDTLYKKHGPDGSGGSMVRDNGVVAPGEFSITSDMPVEKTGFNLKSKVTFLVNDGAWISRFYVTWPIEFNIKGCINEGYRLYLQDNYEPNDDGISPIETHDWGLTLGIMRGSGSDAYVDYDADPDDMEGNDTWDIESGSSVTSHPDTCDNYGNLWDYNHCDVVENSTQATDKLEELFPVSTRNAPFYDYTKGYISSCNIINLYDEKGTKHSTLIASMYSRSGRTIAPALRKYYIERLNGKTVEEMLQTDKTGVELGSVVVSKLIVKIDSSIEQGKTLVSLCKMAYGGGSGAIYIDNGVGSLYGRFSLKLRAEKPNPYYDPTQSETHYNPEHPELNTNPRYLHIDNENLRGRGLADQFYKEYSYWVRNARIVKRTVRMELAQLLAIDKTKKVRVGDIMGFIRKMQYSVSNKTGLGEVTMEIMYI